MTRIGEVHVGRGLADAGVEQPAVQQQRQADEADGAGDAAGDDREQLLLLRRDEQRVDRRRRQQADRVAEEQEQDAEVEQVRAPEQLPLAQQLAGTGLPGVLLAVEADQAAEDEGREADVGIPDEQDVEDGVAHGVDSSGGVAWPVTW